MGDVVSILPQLEPVCGAGFAVGVAYLNLERFRYRNKIRQKANKYKTDLSKSPKYNRLKTHNLDAIALISYLSGLQDHDHMGKKNGKNKSKAPKGAGISCGVYNTFYRKHIDRKICLATSFVAFFALFLGVLHSAGLTGFGVKFFNSTTGGWLTVIALTACTAAPLFFVWVGNFIVKKLSEDAKRAFDQMAGILQDDIVEESTIKDA